MQARINRKILRVGMDRVGLDPTIGCAVSVETITTRIPQLFRMGLWPEATYSLLQMTITVILESDQLIIFFRHRLTLRTSNEPSRSTLPTGEFTFCFNLRINCFLPFSRYGLIPPENISPFIMSLNAVGLDFRMLKTVIGRMELHVGCYFHLIYKLQSI